MSVLTFGLCVQLVTREISISCDMTNIYVTGKFKLWNQSPDKQRISCDRFYLFIYFYLFIGLLRVFKSG